MLELKLTQVSEMDRGENKWGPQGVNTLRQHFADDICKCIFSKGDVCTFMRISLKFAPGSQIINKSTVAKVMSRRKTRVKLLTKQLLPKIKLYTHLLLVITAAN